MTQLWWYWNESTQDVGKYRHSAAVWAYVDFMVKLVKPHGTGKDVSYPRSELREECKAQVSQVKIQFDIVVKRKSNY